jgi:hypothetical protein
LAKLLGIDPGDVSKFAHGKTIAPAYEAKLNDWERINGKWFLKKDS